MHPTKNGLKALILTPYVVVFASLSLPHTKLCKRRLLTSAQLHVAGERAVDCQHDVEAAVA